MSATIRASLVQTGFSCYAVILNLTGQFWNGTAFENYNVAHWSTYVNVMAESVPSGFYSVAFPSTIPAGKYLYLVYNNATPTAGDSMVFDDYLQFDGTNEVLELSAANVLTQVNVALNTTISGPTSGSILADVQQIFSQLPSGTLSNFNYTSNQVLLANNQSGVTVGTVNNLGAAALSGVLSQISTYFGSTTIAELSGVPAATPTPIQALMLLFMALRNTRTSTATTVAIYNSSGAIITTATQSDNGTIYTKGNFT